MATLKYFIMCDSVSEKDGKLSFHGVFDHVSPVSFPAKYQEFFFVLGWVKELSDYLLEIEIIAPDHKSIFKTDQMRISLAETHHTANAVIEIRGLSLHIPGTYWVKIKLNGSEIARYPFLADKVN